MEKYLFVLQGGDISQWKFEDGVLQPVTNEGRRWLAYNAPESYWEEWKADNQFRAGKDSIDALFLCDNGADFPGCPAWLASPQEENSGWTFEMLADLQKDDRINARKVVISQGSVKRSLGAGEGEELCLHLSALLKFKLPKEAPKPVEPEPVKEEPKPGVLIAADCLVDDKSGKIAAGSSITATVKAYSKYRGCFLDTDAADDQLRILPEECQKDAALSTLLQKIGSSVAAQVDSVRQQDGLIQLGLRIEV